MRLVYIIKHGQKSPMAAGITEFQQVESNPSEPTGNFKQCRWA